MSGTPTFFINGRRHYGPYDIDTLSKVARLAGARVAAEAVRGALSLGGWRPDSTGWPSFCQVPTPP